jgi:hypothetical protein
MQITKWKFSKFSNTKILLLWGWGLGHNQILLNHGLTLPNKTCGGSLRLNGYLSSIGACINGKGGGQQNACLHIRCGNVLRADGYLFNLIDNLLLWLKRDTVGKIYPPSLWRVH